MLEGLCSMLEGAAMKDAGLHRPYLGGFFGRCGDVTGMHVATYLIHCCSQGDGIGRYCFQQLASTANACMELCDGPPQYSAW